MTRIFQPTPPKAPLPAHAASIGTKLPPDYFSPGTSVMHGQLIGSLWAIAFWCGKQYRYERAALGLPWVCVSIQ